MAPAQAVTITASAGNVLRNFTIQLNAAILALTINATSVAFGDVVINTPVTQPVTLTSTGNAAVTVSGATLTGMGFTLSGPIFPTTLNPGQATTLNIEFDPVAVGAATGQLTITSNSSINGTAAIGLSGTATAPQEVAVTVTPAGASVNVGATLQFAASVSGSSDTAVTWRVSGPGCSGATCGTISSTGLYNAPVTAPSPATVTITSTSVSDTSKSASAAVTIVSWAGTKYYLAPAAAGGNDSNNGLSPSAPWLTAHHNVKCGDVIIAAPSTAYDSNNFYGGWGTVTCPSGNNVAWLTCATFDGCKASGTYGMTVNQSYWGVSGWEVTTINGKDGGCFAAYPPNSNTNVSHIIFANDVANSCIGGGFTAGNWGSAGVDYVALVGNIAYNAALGSGACAQGFSVGGNVASDSLPGTHIFVAGNFAFGNVNSNPCNGGAPTDGEGLEFDTLSQNNYSMQGVADNNIFVANAGRGIEIYQNAGASPAHLYLRHNTLWDNSVDANQNQVYCGELELAYARNVEEFLNLAQTSSATGCGANLLYAYYVGGGDGTDHVDGNFGFSSSGQKASIDSSPGFSYGPNNIFSDPQFANPVAPGAPNCSGTASVPACMAQVISNFMPINAAAKGYGYQVPSSTSLYDPLFPQWLCNVNLPAGLVTMGCQTGP
jgi:hypothetical protein